MSRHDRVRTARNAHFAGRWCTTAVVCLMTAGLAGCARTNPFVAPSPVGVFTATACPRALGKLQDVAPSVRHGDRLLDTKTRPSTALVCEYGSVFDQGRGPRHTLARRIDLVGAPAEELAAATAAIETGTSAGSVSCPNDSGAVTVLVFGYRDSPPVDLWWHSTGCQTIDDGIVVADQVANDSFGRFQEVFASVTRTAR